MKNKNINVTNKDVSKRLSIWAFIVALILLIPILTKAPWSEVDFILAGLVLFGIATGYELITKNMRNNMHRIIVGIAAILVLISIWAWAVA